MTDKEIKIDMDNEKYRIYLKSQEWREKAYRRMQIDNFQCCGCGCRGTRQNPLECHHVSYRNIGNEDIYTDLLTVCHCCHKLLHKIMERQTDATGRHGWRDSPGVPKIHVYNLSGYFEQKEVEADGSKH